MTVVMGVDPGISGAVAFFYPQTPDRVSVFDVPVAGGEIDTTGLADLIKTHGPTIAMVERAQAFKGQGVVSTFNFGRSYGCILGVVGAMQIPLHLVAPGVWKKALGLTADKEQSRLRVIRMFPVVADQFCLKRHHGRAEASFIALYGAHCLGTVLNDRELRARPQKW
jgi:crossover junction endodeoxyribonuclease RuvC